MIVFPGRVAVIELSYIAEQVMAGSRYVPEYAALKRSLKVFDWPCFSEK